MVRTGWSTSATKKLVQQPYHAGMEIAMKSQTILQECVPGSTCWQKMAAGASNIRVRQISALNQFLLDEDIEIVIGSMCPEEAGKNCHGCGLLKQT